MSPELYQSKLKSQLLLKAKLKYHTWVSFMLLEYLSDKES